MATYNSLFVSAVNPSDQAPVHSLPNSYTLGQLNCGTSTAISTTTQDLFELTVVTGATYQITKQDIIAFLRLVEEWVMEDPGTMFTTSSSVSPDETGYGLDGMIRYLVEDGNTVAAIP